MRKLLDEIDDISTLYMKVRKIDLLNKHPSFRVCLNLMFYSLNNSILLSDFTTILLCAVLLPKNILKMR